jgi:hypothetical protein
MNKIKNLFNIQIIIFTLIIVSLFLYLFKIEVNIRNFNNYKNEINNLKSLNLEFDIFLNKQDKFINFDEIVEKTKSFDNILDKLEKSEIKQDFGSTIIQKLDDVEKSYYKKLDVIERFKSIQATTLNSVHFVYDINEYYETLDINKSAKLYINNIQFLLMQYLIWII